jgi:hypothetical protein
MSNSEQARRHGECSNRCGYSNTDILRVQSVARGPTMGFPQIKARWHRRVGRGH